MPELLRLKGLLAKSEVSYGVDPTPSTATDGVRVARDLFSTIQVDYEWENLRDEVATDSIIPLTPAIPRGRRVRMDIFWEVKGKGSDAAPEAAPLYIACGLPETDGSAIFDYGPLTSGTKGSATIYAYAGGLVFKVVGCRGRFQWPIMVGQIAVHQFTMFGLLSEAPSTASVPSISGYDSSEPIAGVNTALAIGAFSPDWLSGSLDLTGIDPVALHSGNAADGIKEFDFGTSEPTFELTYRKVALATYDPYADRLARTSRNLVMTWGPAQFNRVKVVSAALVPIAHTHGDSEGFVNHTVRYRIISGGVIRFD